MHLPDPRLLWGAGSAPDTNYSSFWRCTSPFNRYRPVKTTKAAHDLGVMQNQSSAASLHPTLQQGSGKRPEEWNTGNSLKQGFSQKFHILKCPESRDHNKCLQWSIYKGVKFKRTPKGGFHTFFSPPLKSCWFQDQKQKFHSAISLKHYHLQHLFTSTSSTAFLWKSIFYCLKSAE